MAMVASMRKMASPTTTRLLPALLLVLLSCCQVLARDDHNVAFQEGHDLIHPRIRGASTNNNSNININSNSINYRHDPSTSKKVLVGNVQAVYDLIDRVLKDPSAKDSICLEIVDQEEDDDDPYFRLQEQPSGACKSRNTTTSTSTAASSITQIAIVATSASELTAGLGHYFKHYCNFTIEWSTGGRAGGSHIVMPEVWPVPVPEPVVKTRITQWSYLMNVCTHSYSLVWYDWNSWQAFIDNLALRGINMVLALTGQEEIQYKVFRKLGLQDLGIRSWFNGPAFLTWSRGQNEYGSGIAGPLPRSFMKNQWHLQQKILPRLRSLGMIGILPAFQGNVPIQLKEIYNNTNITQQGQTGWMNAMDPLFAKVADLWMEQLLEDFGTDHYYQLDGWFNGGVPPWMNDKGMTNKSKQQEQQNSTVTIQRRSLEEASSPQLLEHDEGWYQRGRAAYMGLNRTDPDAHWMYQGFAFIDWSTPEQSSYLKGFVDSVPHGKFIVIDMAYSHEGEWQKWANASFFGAPFIWTKLYNFGDSSGMRGDLDHINRDFPYKAIDAKSSIAGIGGTPEGIDHNPIYFDFLYEQNFRSVPVKNLTSYIIQLNHKRYGLRESNPDVGMIWKLLLRSVYSQDFNVHDLTAVSILNPDPANSLFEKDRVTPKPIFCDMINALQYFFAAGAKMQHKTEPFMYDLVNIQRETFAQLSIPLALDFSDARSKESMEFEELKKTGKIYIKWLLDLDQLLAYNVGFLLEPWLESARRLAREDVTGSEQNDCFSPILTNESDTGCCSCFYEFNARSQITTWNPTPYGADRVPGGPVDYAAKHWSGLVEGYYAKRANILLMRALKDQANGQPLNSTEVDRLFAAHAYEWTTSVNRTHNNHTAASSLLSFQEIVRRSTEILQKYNNWWKSCPRE